MEPNKNGTPISSQFVNTFNDPIQLSVAIPKATSEDHCKGFWTIADFRSDKVRGVLVPSTSSESKRNKPIRSAIANERRKSLPFWLKSSTSHGAIKDCSYNATEHDVVSLSLSKMVRDSIGKQDIAKTMAHHLEKLEKAFTYFEKTSAYVLHRSFSYELPNRSNVVCDVCRIAECSDCDEILFCEQCNVAVHQFCYSVAKVPAGGWYCEACLCGGAEDMCCFLCPNKFGAFRKLEIIDELANATPEYVRSRCLRLSLLSKTNDSYWCHMSCALWSRLIDFETIDKSSWDIRLSIGPLNSNWWSNFCSLCHIRMGVCINCDEPGCPIVFHVTCALKNDLAFVKHIKSKQADGVISQKWSAFCSTHSPFNGSCSSKRFLENAGNLAGKTKPCYERSRDDNPKFYETIDLNSAEIELNVTRTELRWYFNYWKTLRKDNHNLPLIS